MDVQEREALAAGYVRYREALSGEGWKSLPDQDPDEQAFDTVERILRRGPAVDAWELTLAVLRIVSDSELGLYAAGVLEDCVRYQGAALVDNIERLAASDERFRWALGCIWLDEGELPPPALARVVRASGGRIKPIQRRDPARAGR